MEGINLLRDIANDLTVERIGFYIASDRLKVNIDAIRETMLAVLSVMQDQYDDDGR